ncbi:hypothetical protein EUX98_g1658 [Antrodiella citrinella]|uniref:Protein kinase domain-containing protein n=1 Tax=Antrodiella citrinella TaxID=2447956 RepID=A0A4V3XJB6_9APHY|nr:hypothetical protein EUX98_g1658 [Antrodiella citrinella]
MAKRITSHEIRQIIQTALNNAHNNLPTEALSSLSEPDARVVLDEMWRILDSPASPTVAIGGLSFAVYRTTLKRVTLKLALEHHILPESLILMGVERLDEEQRGTGSFSDVFYGTYQGRKVALKRLRVFVMSSKSQKENSRKAGVSEDIFKGTLCMVLLWCESGSLRDHLASIREEGVMSDDDLAMAIDKWLHQTTLGLQYLHEEGIIHGDLHAGNILLNECGNACLTDFGMSLIAGGTGYNYGSVHGGGAMRWQAPELIDPEMFGLEGTRPTTQSDVFSIACTAIELYSGHAPLPNLNDLQVVRRYLSGKRPPRPSLPGGQIMGVAMWSMLKACWAQDRRDRISVHEAVLRMAGIVGRAATSVEQLTASMSTIDVQDSRCSFISVGAAYHDDTWNVDKMKRRAVDLVLSVDPAKQSALTDRHETITKQWLRSLAKVWELLEDYDYANAVPPKLDLASERPHLKTCPDPRLSRLSYFIWAWASQIVQTKMHITQPYDQSHVNINTLLQAASVKADDEEFQMALFASRCAVSGVWVPIEGGYRCDGDLTGCEKHKVTTDELNAAAEVVSRDPQLMDAFTKLHLYSESMFGEKQTAYLDSDDAQTALCLVGILMELAGDAVKANEIFMKLRDGYHTMVEELVPVREELWRSRRERKSNVELLC